MRCVIKLSVLCESFTQVQRVLNPGSRDLHASALTTGPHCLHGISYVRSREVYYNTDYLTEIKGNTSGTLLA